MRSNIYSCSLLQRKFVPFNRMSYPDAERVPMGLERMYMGQIQKRLFLLTFFARDWTLVQNNNHIHTRHWFFTK
jgi:hypothetical protein